MQEIAPTPPTLSPIFADVGVITNITCSLSTTIFASTNTLNGKK
jgi:hypothetical protein